MPRDSPNLLAHTRTPGNRNFGIQQALAGLEVDPEFEFSQIGQSARRIKIEGRQTGSGDSQWRVPWRITLAGSGGTGRQLETSSDEWTLDLNTTVINLDTMFGGLIDSVALAADKNYLVWAFFDPFDSGGTKFKGFGLTTKPEVTGASVSSGGGLGVSITLSVGANQGSRFSDGARILVRAGDVLGDDWNQGTITSRTTSSITATMDAVFAGVAEANTALSGTLDVFQLDNFQPRMATSDNELYPGSGTEYSFA